MVITVLSDILIDQHPPAHTLPNIPTLLPKYPLPVAARPTTVTSWHVLSHRSPNAIPVTACRPRWPQADHHHILLLCLTPVKLLKTSDAPDTPVPLIWPSSLPVSLRNLWLTVYRLPSTSDPLLARCRLIDSLSLRLHRRCIAAHWLRLTCSCWCTASGTSTASFTRPRLRRNHRIINANLCLGASVPLCLYGKIIRANE